MGIQVEFNPDLALRNYRAFLSGKRREDECIPQNLDEGEVYPFFKKGQRNYWLEGEIPLLETNGRKLSDPLAAIIILEATHANLNGGIYTFGKYKVIKKIAPRDIYFNGFGKVK